MAPVTHAPRVTVVTAGHLSTCPRMVKAADAFNDSGYAVRVVSASHTPWAVAADRAVKSLRPWCWTTIDYARESAQARRVLTGARRRAAVRVSRGAGASRVPLSIAIRAYSRIHDELVRAIVAEPADIIYGGTTGALAAVAEAADRMRVPYGLDLEDFHSGEHAEGVGDLDNTLAERIEGAVLPAAAALTAGSPMIAEAYHEKYGVAPVAIHNTFSLGRAVEQPAPGPLRVYWFSQTLDAGRGLEHVILAMGASGVPVRLDLRGRVAPGYAARLDALARQHAPKLEVRVLPPAAPDDMVLLASGYDLGLSCDEPLSVSRRLCLPNKLFTYLAAGVPVALSDTPAQAAFAEALHGAAIVYRIDRPDALVDCVRRWAADEGCRREAARAARAAAESRWHWEHPADRGALLDVVGAALGVAS